MALPRLFQNAFGGSNYSSVAHGGRSRESDDEHQISMVDREAYGGHTRRKSSDATMVNDDDNDDEERYNDKYKYTNNLDYTNNDEDDGFEKENAPLAGRPRGQGSASAGQYHEAGSMFSFYGDEPTDEERKTLRKVPDNLPWSAFLVAAVELCERFAYFGLSGPFQNYIANKYHDPNGLPGALGLAQTGATALTSFFQFWCFITPIIGAIVADQYLGKYLTIFYFSLVYIVGIFILFITSIPWSIENGYAFPGLLVSMVVIGLATGGIKANVSPLIGEQYKGVKQKIKVLETGERVIVDPGVTIQRIYMLFYMCINLGSLSALVTTTLEQRVGFWAAYFLPMIMFIFGFFILVSGKNRYVVRPPKGSVVVHSFQALWIGAKNKGNLDAAKPSVMAERGQRQNHIPWSDLFIDELKRAVVACKVFCFFPIYWLCFNQMLNNFISQAGQMELHHIPNDIMQNIDPIAIIIFIPLMDRIVYPLLRRNGIAFKPITRIFFGFMVGSLAMAYAALVQGKIYASGPCYTNPGRCAASIQKDGTHQPNKVHVALQTPAYILIGLSEIFASVTGIEYAFTKAPPSMKSFINALYLLTTAIGALLGAALAPSAKDPHLTTLYIGLSIACGVAGLLFWWMFNGLNREEEKMNELERFGERAVSVDTADAVRRDGGSSRL